MAPWLNRKVSPRGAAFPKSIRPTFSTRVLSEVIISATSPRVNFGPATVAFKGRRKRTCSPFAAKAETASAKNPHNPQTLSPLIQVLLVEVSDGLEHLVGRRD